MSDKTTIWVRHLRAWQFCWLLECGSNAELPSLAHRKQKTATCMARSTRTWLASRQLAEVLHTCKDVAQNLCRRVSMSVSHFLTPINTVL